MKTIPLSLFFFCSCLCFAQGPQLYGMTYAGGAHQCGTIFKMNGEGSGFETAYSFDSLAGMNPYGTLLQADDGKLYGMTFLGGLYHDGVIFSFDPSSHVYADLHDFNFTDGAFPYGSLIQATNGKLYGMTSNGGTKHDGVIFSFDPVTKTYTKLFDLVDSLGAVPKGDLLQASNGKLYGLASTGGTKFKGTLFSFDLANNKFTRLVDFNTTNGAFGYGSLIEYPAGKLYGTTTQGGLYNKGVLFEYDLLTNTYSKQLEFQGPQDKSPASGLMFGSNSKLYGMTSSGGANFKGSIYSFNTVAGQYASVVDFDSTNGSLPVFNTLMQATDGIVYGMTTYGGPSNYGVAFRLDIENNIYTRLVDFTGANGKNPNGAFIELRSPTAIMNKRNDAFIVYPNPAGNQLRIQSAECRIEIFNSLGEKISAISQGNSEIDISHLQPGLYFLKLNDKNEVLKTARFIKN